MKKLSLILSLVMFFTITFNHNSVAQWSPQAKGTVIGAGTGAAAGAIIHKRNRVVGGVVGGVAGGAAGYAIGKHKDNKNKEAARVAAANRAAAERAAAANRAASTKVASRTTKQSSPEKAQPVANTAQGFAAAPGALVASNAANPMQQILNAGYLPNHDYGDTSKPYHTSEVRRKSW